MVLRELVYSIKLMTWKKLIEVNENAKNSFQSFRQQVMLPVH